MASRDAQPGPATIVDVAARAGVSVATVSRALRNHAHVAEPTRQRVLEAAAALRYVADANASRLASGRSNTIGVVAPILTSWYTSEVVAGVEEVLQIAQLDLLISTGVGIDSSYLLGPDTAFRQRVDGMILVDVFWHEQGARALASSQTPAIVIGERVHAVTSLSIDNELGAEMATRHLLELGHRRIGLIGGALSPVSLDAPPEQRARGFHRALAGEKIKRERSLRADGEFTIEGGRRAARQLLSLPDPPTALFCLSDEMAFGALQLAREIDRRVPDEVSIVGFDDHPASEAFGLSTVRQPVREMGRLAAQLMIDTLAGHEQSPRHHPLGLALVARSSTAAVAK